MELYNLHSIEEKEEEKKKKRTSKLRDCAILYFFSAGRLHLHNREANKIIKRNK